ncbi:MAG: hypothetical protein EOP53_26315 [Sphingobacteriales bacterium]|nr:MAG: hypothetical protein EOP53_26315 [Sphingobacteriales bacterium]
MKKITLISSLCLFCNFLLAQKIKDGIYNFKIKDLEYHGMVVGTCKAIVKGDSVKLIYTGGNLTLIKPGDIYAEGLLLKHKRTNQWIIGTKKEDANAKEAGPCSDNGIRTINFKHKIIEQC